MTPTWPPPPGKPAINRAMSLMSFSDTRSTGVAIFATGADARAAGVACATVRTAGAVVGTTLRTGVADGAVLLTGGAALLTDGAVLCAGDAVGEGAGWRYSVVSYGRWADANDRQNNVSASKAKSVRSFIRVSGCGCFGLYASSSHTARILNPPLARLVIFCFEQKHEHD